MLDYGNLNINDKDYWDQVYKGERGSGKRRIDNERWEYLVGTMQGWMGQHPDVVEPILLDVGCGNGEMMRLLHARLPEWGYAGVDITPETIEWCKTRDPHMKFYTMDALDLTLPKNYYAIVWCGETLEHLTHPEEAIKQMQEVLRDDGQLVCSVPNERNNYSPEHLKEFTVWDALNLTTHGDMTKLVNVNVKCNGISTIWTSLK